MLTTPQPPQQVQPGGKPRDGQHETPERPLREAGLTLWHDGKNLRAHVAVSRIAAGGIDGKHGFGHAAQHIPWPPLRRRRFPFPR